MAGIGIMRPVPWQETPFSKGYFTLLYDFLMGANVDGSMSAANGATEKWEMSPDDMTWTFWLRQGITFHNGTELSAEDVKCSLEMVTEPESIVASAARLRDTIKEIEETTPYSLIIRTHKPDLWPAQDLSMAAGYQGAIRPKKYFEHVGADGFAAKAIGSGPYKWVKGLTGSYIQLGAVDKHWAEGIPKYKRLTYTVVQEENTRIKVPQLDALIEGAQTATTEAEAKKSLGQIHRWLDNDYATLPIAQASILFVTDLKKVTKWDLGRTLYDNNDRDLIRR
jgi:ABC-type transport system substrate-binding protein